MLACTSIVVNQWLVNGRSADQLHQRDWDRYVAALPAGEAKAMEVRLILDEVRFELFGGYIDPITQAREESSVFKLSRLYAARNRTPEAISTLKKAFSSWQDRKIKHFYPDLKDWDVLCRLYNQQHQYAESVQVIEAVSKRFPDALYTPSRGHVEFQRLAAEAYEGVGKKPEADRLRAVIARYEHKPSKQEKAQKMIVIANWDVRLARFDYAVSLLHEGRAAQAAKALEKLADITAVRREKDTPRSRARILMMLPVSYTAAQRWEDAERNFPRALRLAAQQQYAPASNNAKPAVYEAYAALLAHQGKVAESVKYSRMAEEARNANMSKYGDDSKNVFSESDLYE